MFKTIKKVMFQNTKNPNESNLKFFVSMTLNLHASPRYALILSRCWGTSCPLSSLLNLACCEWGSWLKFRNRSNFGSTNFIIFLKWIFIRFCEFQDWYNTVSAVFCTVQILKAFILERQKLLNFTKLTLILISKFDRISAPYWNF